MMDLTFGLSTTTLAIIAIILGLIGWNVIKTGISLKGRGYAKILAFVFALLIIVPVMGLEWPSEAPPADVSDVAQWSVTASESMSHVTQDAVSRHFTVAMNFNDTTDAFNSATQYFQANFTVQRLDTSIEDAITNAKVTYIPAYSTTSGMTYDILVKGTDHQHEADWTNSQGSTAPIEMTVPYKGSVRVDYIIVNMTASAACVAEMSQYESLQVTLTIGGTSWSIEWLKATITT